MLKITHTKFIEFQRKFFQTVKGLPVMCTFHEIHNDPNGSGFDALMKTSPKLPETTFKLQALYKKDFTPYDRVRYGLRENVSGIIWFSPLELKRRAGIVTLKEQNYKVHFDDIHDSDQTYQIDCIKYLEPMYNTCIAIEIHLVDNRRT